MLSLDPRTRDGLPLSRPARPGSQLRGKQHVRAHEGATHHLGKVPARRGGSGVPAKRSLDVAKLRKELARAVEAEDYERAAKLRDSIKQAEG